MKGMTLQHSLCHQGPGCSPGKCRYESLSVNIPWWKVKGDTTTRRKNLNIPIAILGLVINTLWYWSLCAVNHSQFLLSAHSAPVLAIGAKRLSSHLAIFFWSYGASDLSPCILSRTLRLEVCHSFGYGFSFQRWFIAYSPLSYPRPPHPSQSRNKFLGVVNETSDKWWLKSVNERTWGLFK